MNLSGEITTRGATSGTPNFGTSQSGISTSIGTSSSISTGTTSGSSTVTSTSTIGATSGETVTGLPSQDQGTSTPDFLLTRVLIGSVFGVGN